MLGNGHTLLEMIYAHRVNNWNYASFSIIEIQIEISAAVLGSKMNFFLALMIAREEL